MAQIKRTSNLLILLLPLAFTDAFIVTTKPKWLLTTTLRSETPPNNNNENNEEDPFADFDPRISPHMYPNGIPSPKPESTSTPSSSAEAAANNERPTKKLTKVGVLIIDHGSRRAASNAHLHKLAATYQNSPRCPNHFVVRGCHMEIATPGIRDGIEELVSLGAARIVCHPYFLSPGRHATEDVPRLIDEAVKELDLGGRVRVVTTNPVGSHLNVMVNVIGDLVEEEIKSGFPKADDDDGLGMFGDVMRMMEEIE